MTDHTDKAETDLQERLARFQRVATARIEQDSVETPEVAALELQAKLEKGGFPKRHREMVGAMVGPSLAKADELLPRILQGDALLLLIGNRGPGKTQMATYWASQRVREGRSAGRYIKCADLIGEIKSTWHDGGKSVGTEQDVLKKYRSAKYLVIDEFHERGGSDWESRCLINLIDHRYDDMLATVLIANLSEEEVKRTINPSIIDRATQTGGMIECNWPSYRAMKGAA